MSVSGREASSSFVPNVSFISQRAVRPGRGVSPACEVAAPTSTVRRLSEASWQKTEKEIRLNASIPRWFTVRLGGAMAHHGVLPFQYSAAVLDQFPQPKVIHFR